MLPPPLFQIAISKALPVRLITVKWKIIKASAEQSISQECPQAPQHRGSDGDQHGWQGRDTGWEAGTRTMPPLAGTAVLSDHISQMRRCEEQRSQNGAGLPDTGEQDVKPRQHHRPEVEWDAEELHTRSGP